ncbi:MAG: prepilin-type N-terminal cleavage/methylation domain-containing protein [Deltaproteobacteria bacterium]|nr:prepilin-type N-terminal cleavage/methylation domain-containing protein [Deltaproteobacteria bacterium]
MKRLASNNQGFTMIEIVAVLVVLLIVSTVVMSRYTTTGTNELIVETDGLKASLRYVQIQALNDDTTTWGIHIPDDSSYILYKNGSAASVMIPVKIPDPVKDPPPNNTHRLQGNTRITSGVGTTVTFDKWGSPGTTTISITLAQGTETSTITITRNTGFIQ